MYKCYEPQASCGPANDFHQMTFLTTRSAARILIMNLRHRHGLLLTCPAVLLREGRPDTRERQKSNLALESSALTMRPLCDLQYNHIKNKIVDHDWFFTFVMQSLHDFVGVQLHWYPISTFCNHCILQAVALQLCEHHRLPSHCSLQFIQRMGNITDYFTQKQFFNPLLPKGPPLDE